MKHPDNHLYLEVSVSLRHLIVSLSIAVPALMGERAIAQSTEPYAFHGGQWGIEFNVAGGFGGAGVLRFTGPAHAWLADLDVSYAHTRADGPNLSGFRGTNGTLDLGSRSYHALGSHVQRLMTFGALFTYTRESNQGNSFTVAGGGLFADLGASWLVTPHLGIGGRWRVSAVYLHAKASNLAGVSTADNVTLSAGSVALSGQIYF